MTATDLMTDLAKIQKATGTKRTALLAEAKKRWAGHRWSSEEMTQWARWAWVEGTR